MDFKFEIFRNVVSIGQNFKSFDVLVLLNILGLDIADEISYTVDIVSKGQTTESFYNDDANSFFVISRSDISKAHCQHNGRTPVITPSVLFIPWTTLKVHFCNPTA